MTRGKTVLVIASLAVTLMSLASLSLLPSPAPAPEVPRLAEASDAPVKVAVLNGCGREGLAAVFAEKLRSQGFDVVNGLGGNADSFDFEESLVLDRRGAHDRAERIADALGIEAVLEQRSDDPYLIEDVVVIIGRDWDSLRITTEDFID